ncbi:molybdenum cofactor biosynthesis protein B [Jeotgalibacillus sp. R-1-5s-1]|uniref:MogA/MoaB family molybdenum cofactor biosynthesis protein n=1 Tax=Jeotgalibacillus sp. R-1-5s-1 TaxID=2555897 RepID=UPI00106C8A03|nr:molybdenum cofactor biosynthesis protein B [Jeotgalibacillus sp. R-1-5s-1]TFE01856.1 molybdenum cofactor biosynthesis protein MoaB [Jeotgalibacillus sp. R-1-5s-1]
MLSEHRKKSSKSVACKVITVSDTRTEETDKSGRLMIDLLKKEGHQIIHYEIVTDERILIERAIQSGLKDEKVEAILINGGTGVAPRDVTIEVVKPLLEKELPGFGEIFRYLSYTEDIGSAAILSRACAGTANKTVVFSTPGSSGAVKLAMEKLILPEIGHLAWELTR